jgi:hypothetical protein
MISIEKLPPYRCLILNLLDLLARRVHRQPTIDHPQAKGTGVIKLLLPRTEAGY